MILSQYIRGHLYWQPGWTLWRVKPAAVTGGLFMKHPNLNGISIGGPFFANPIG